MADIAVGHLRFAATRRTRVEVARTWSSRALTAWGAAQLLVSGGLVVGLVSAAETWGGVTLGHGVLRALLALATAILLAVTGGRTLQLAHSIGDPLTVPAPARAAARAGQGLAALAFALGVHSMYAGAALLGIGLVACALLGLLSAGAWASRAPGALPRAALLATLAGVLWLVATAAFGPVLPHAHPTLEAAFRAVVPSGMAVFVAVASLMAFAVLRRSATRTLALAGAGLAGFVASLDALVGSLDLVQGQPWNSMPGTWHATIALGLVLGALATVLVASVLGLVASSATLATYGPSLLARVGSGFMAPEPGAVCGQCGLLSPVPGNFCPDCGTAMPRPGTPA